MMGKDHGWASESIPGTIGGYDVANCDAEKRWEIVCNESHTILFVCLLSVFPSLSSKLWYVTCF